jgi:hypothetical protein
MMAFEYCAKLHAKRTIIPFDVIPGAWTVRLFCGTRKPARPIASDDNPDGSAVSVRFKIPQLHSRYVRYDFRNGCSPGSGAFPFGISRGETRHNGIVCESFISLGHQTSSAK